MASSNERPHISDLSGAWPSTSANSFRQNYLQPVDGNGQQNDPRVMNNAALTPPNLEDTPRRSSENTAVTPGSDLAIPPVTSGSSSNYETEKFDNLEEEDVEEHDHEKAGYLKDEEANEVGQLEPLRTAQSSKPAPRPGLAKTSSRVTEEDLFKSLSRRKTSRSDRQGSVASIVEGDEQAEIERLMSRMFGKTRQAHSEEEQTRHVGVVFKELTVKGMGLGAALQPTLSDPFLALPRLLKSLFSKGPKGATGKPPVRTILNKFTGCIRPGEMCLVLGRPGSGCSSFLKVLANQRSGFESIDGDVTYGGTDSKTMGKDYRGEILYNPEDDLHYATLTVKNTLSFALKTRTPGKESRNEGESRADYVREFLRVVAKLFWIEHTMGTKVGDEYVRGVSGGEKKRVSIAEAMITRASTQCWDNSTRGLDASTALEYVQSLRSLTNMAHISTAVALYQAGESLYDSFDKVVLIDEGKCLYYGPTDEAAAYFEGLGFARPARWTTADFVSESLSRWQYCWADFCVLLQLTSVTDPHERQIREGYEGRIPRSAEQFEAMYRESAVFENTKLDVQNFEQQTEELRRERLAHRTKATKKKNYTLSFPKQVTACTNRQFLVMFGDRQSLIGKWGGILFQALIVGSLFYNMPKTTAGAFTRGGVLFFMLLFNALLALAELTAAFSSRPIMLKHKSLYVPLLSKPVYVYLLTA